MAGLLLTGAALSSCEDDYFRKEPEFPAGEEYTDEITFGMSLPEDWNPLSRSAADDSASWVNPEPVETGIEIDGKKLYLSLTVSDRRGAGPSREVQNSGSAEMGATPRGSQGVTLEDVKDFGIYAYIRSFFKFNDNSVSYNIFMQNTHVKADDFSYSPLKYWPGMSAQDRHGLRFMAYMPYDAYIGTSSSPLAIELPILADYNYKHNDGDDASVLVYPPLPKLTFTVPDDASEQIDLMAAVSEPPVAAGNGGFRDYFPFEYPNDYFKKVNFQFHHLLSEVKFKAGSIAEGVITGIGLHNVYGSGEASIDETAMTPTGAADKSFTQDFEHGIDESTPANSVIGEPFYMIPQSFANDAPSLSIDVAYKAKVGNRVTNYTVDKPLNIFSAAWQAGKSYTYTITVPHEVEVEVTDNVESNVKKNLVIKNKGVAPSFIRVQIAGCWIAQSEEDASRYNIVGDWKASDGTFDWGGSEPTLSATSGWLKGTDGYYYYLGQVPAGSVIPKALFNTYKLTAAAPSTGAILELYVVAQAVSVLDIDAATSWDATALAKLKTLASQ